MQRLRRKLGLERPEAVAWALYDWANSVFMTTVLQVFPIYFTQVAAHGLPVAEGNRRFSIATTAGMAAIALLAPLLGAMADYGRLKKRMLTLFVLIGVGSTLGLACVQRGQWALAACLFVLANVGVSGSIVFNDSLLPHVAAPDEMDRLTSTAFALGYLSGGLLLALNALWIRYPAAFGLADAWSAMRLSFLSAGLWWLVFSLPVLLRVPEPAGGPQAREAPGRALVPAAFERLRQTFHALRPYRHAFLFLLAFLVYSDGIGTIVRMGTMYGSELGIPTGQLLLAVLMIQLVGVPCALAFGWLAGRIGAKRGILLSLGVYVLVTFVGYRMTSTADFFVLAFLIALVQGGSQALSKSLFATLVPRHKSSEFFGFFGVFEKFGGVLGPALFAGVIGATGSGRGAILGLSILFALGALLLAGVDVASGQRAARRAEACLGAEGEAA